jgi:hypothetical protein
MRKTIPLVLAASLISGLAVAQAQQADRATDRDNRNLAQQPSLPDGFQMKELKQIDNIRGRLADVTNYALTKGDFGKVVDQLAVFNRDQMKNWRDQDYKTLDGVIDQINKEWKSKYGHEFKAKDSMFDDRFMSVQGVVTDPNVAATNFPVRARSDDARLAGGREHANVDNAERKGEQRLEREGSQVDHVAAKDLQDSKNIATLHFPDSHGLPGVTASLIEEGMIGKWHFAAPKSLTAQQLHQAIQNQLTYVGRDATQWPANETDAYRMVAHRVLLALYNIDTKDGAHAGEVK